MNRNKNGINCKTRTSNMKESKDAQKVPYKFKSKSNKGGKNKSKQSREADDHYINHDGVPGKQDAGLYFGDLQLAEDNSYVSSRNVLDIRRKMPGTDFYYPTLFVHGFNPSPGVSYVDFRNFIVYPSGLKLAANQIKTAIIANNGRISNYTSVDIIILLLMIGEYISMTEFMRRVFGAKYKFAELNRDIPKSFIEAMGFDYDDFIDNLNSYQSRANKLINYGAPIVIPMDKIPYLRKCRDLYQDIYQDQAAGQMCYHINVPRTTWLLKEDETFGTRLQTVGVTQDLSKFYCFAADSITGNPGGTSTAQKFVQRIRHQKFGDFLDNVYEPLVMSLTTSETFNNIYSDLRAAKFQSVYPFSFWRPELITLDYECPVVESEDWLNIYHNARVVGDVTYGLDYKFVDTDDAPVLPKLNDVVTDPLSDDLRYNPLFVRGRVMDMVTNQSTHFEAIPKFPYILDFKETEPHVNKRVDAMIYTAWPRGRVPESTSDFNAAEFQCNWLLPDHYMTNLWAYVGDIHADVPDDLHFWPVSYNNKIQTPVTGRSVEGGYEVDDIYDEIVNGQYNHVASTYIIHTNNARILSERAQAITYLEGAPIGFEIRSERLESETGKPKIYDIMSYPTGNLDQWYVLDLTKFENMFDHVYQYIFTADGIVK